MYGDCDSWIPVFLSLRKFPGSVLYQWKSEKMKKVLEETRCEGVSYILLAVLVLHTSMQ